ncbi:hypothetical protein [Methylobacterium nonmethylotrophicum]|uniref:Uncharacterized protein n=1 Tax=Methylobacterium nonmethylotrophicum TaxID=1141884 RepID=A0A4Z0NW51_9HYPH|nr:hypothetical protein [Methylobacterium nonmethylotrophicum]TGE01971.1 hypothetical protein EU555_04715 [Methylobacterium nonmethylotrophicum]
MNNDFSTTVAIEAIRSALSGKNSQLSDSARTALVNDIASRVIVNSDGSTLWKGDDGEFDYRDGAFTSPFTAVRNMVRANPARFGVGIPAPETNAGPPTPVVPKSPADLSKLTPSEVMRLARENPEIRAHFASNPLGNAKTIPNMTELMVAARSGDNAALAALNARVGGAR